MGHILWDNGITEGVNQGNGQEVNELPRRNRRRNPGRQYKSIEYALHHPPEFKVDRNFEKEKEKIEEKLSRPEREEKEWKQTFLQVQTNRFIVDTEENRIHDRSCQRARNLSKERFTMREDFDGKLKKCEDCYFKAVIRQMTEKPEEYKKILELLEYVAVKDLERLMEGGAVIRYVTYNTLEIQHGEDRWRLEKNSKRNFALFHNSYILEESRRRFTGKFHLQQMKREYTFHNDVAEILGYNSDFHIEQALEINRNTMKQALDTAPENHLLYPTPATVTFYWPTVRRIRRKGILFDYFMYVDCAEDFAPAIFQKRKIRLYKLHELTGISDGYKLVFCKIPKWQRHLVFAAVSDVKRAMYKIGLQKGYNVMKAAKEYFAARGIESVELKSKSC